MTETHPTPAHRRQYLAALAVLKARYWPGGITEAAMRDALRAAERARA
jgi:hypothetical protein